MNRCLKTCCLGALLYVVLLWAALGLFRPRIELNLNDRVKAEFDEIGDICEDFSVELNGRDCSIKGSVYEASHRDRVVASIKRIKGIRKVDDGLRVKPLKPCLFRIRKAKEGLWKMDGRVLQGGTASVLTETLRKTLVGEEELEVELIEERHVAQLLPAYEIANVFIKFREFVPRANGLEVSSGQVIFFGETFSEERRDQALDFFRSHFADARLEIINKISILPPTDAATIQILPLNDGGFSVTGLLQDLYLKERVFDLIRQANGEKLIQDQVIIGDYIEVASWGTSLIRMIPALVAEVDKLQLSLSSNSFLMSGIVRGNEKKQALELLAQQSFEDQGTGFTIANQLTVFVPPEKASVTMFRGEDGLLYLTGVLPELKLSEQFSSVTTAEIGKNQSVPKNQIEVRENVDNAPWVAVMVDLMSPFLNAVQWGALSIHGNQVALEAEVFDSVSGDVLRALVENAFPVPDYKRIVEIRIAEPPGPSEEDIIVLEKTVMQTVIYFDSDSSKVQPDERVKLESLADHFGKVPGTSLALLGYADPYGNADYNRNLSRKRCEAVRDSLIELGINFLLLELEVKGESETVVDGRVYESGRRVEFELR